MRIFQTKGSERNKAQTDPKDQFLEKMEPKCVNMTLCRPLKLGQQKERRGCSIIDKDTLESDKTAFESQLGHFLTV